MISKPTAELAYTTIRYLTLLRAHCRPGGRQSSPISEAIIIKWEKRFPGTIRSVTNDLFWDLTG